MPVEVKDDHQRALALAAHPDDIDFMCAGTIAQWVEMGIDVSYVLVTRGDQGGFDDTPREDMPHIREAEQIAAAKVVGVNNVIFLEGYRDGHVKVTDELICDLTAVIRRLQPHRMIIPSPERNYRMLYISHPDHLAVGEAAIQAIYPASRNPFAFPHLHREEKLEMWHVRDVWIAAHPEINHIVDISNVIDRKLEALRAHHSQAAHLENLDAEILDHLSQVAENSGLPDGRLAEGFMRISC